MSQAADDAAGYVKLARHFGWAIGQAFDAGAERVIVVEVSARMCA